MIIPSETVELALAQIVEPMYFREVAHLGSGMIPDPLVAATLSFEGPLSGSFTVALTEELALSLTGEFLVEDAAVVSLDESRSMVGELTNIVCGNILGVWMPDGDFSFATPQQAQSQGNWFPYVFSLDGTNPQFAISVLFRSN